MSNSILKNVVTYFSTQYLFLRFNIYTIHTSQLDGKWEEDHDLWVPVSSIFMKFCEENSTKKWIHLPHMFCVCCILPYYVEPHGNGWFHLLYHMTWGNFNIYSPAIWGHPSGFWPTTSHGVPPCVEALKTSRVPSGSATRSILGDGATKSDVPVFTTCLFQTCLEKKN